MGRCSSPGNAPTIWAALIQAGASAIQAAAILGNMVHESGLDPECAGQDTNGLQSVGLVQWNAGGYPNAGSMLTGNVANDIKTQVAFLVSSGGLAAASGSDPGTAASNFAHSYERCATCGYQGGTAQLTARAQSAQQFYSSAQSGNWPSATTSGTAATTTAAQTTAASSSSANCALSFPTVIAGTVCIVTKSELKAAKSGLLVGAGGLIFGMGAIVLVAFAFQRSGAGRAARQIAKVTPIGKVAAIPKARSAERRATAASTRRVGETQARTARTQAQAAVVRERRAATAQRHSERLIQLREQSAQRRAETTNRERQRRLTERRRTQEQITRREHAQSSRRYRAAQTSGLQPGEEPF